MINPLTGLEEEDQDSSLPFRRRQLARQRPGGLRALALDTQPMGTPIETSPLRGGELSRPPELEQPAPLSTEAVPRVPSVLQATPLLDQRERAGAMLAEAERGEESLPGPGGGGLSNQARQQSLMNFFRPARAGGAPSEEGPSDVAEGFGTARRVVGGLRQAKSLAEQFFSPSDRGSFQMSPEIRAAWEAQRGGERMDFGGAFPGGGGELPPGLDSYDQWLSAAGEGFGGAIPAESLMGIEAGVEGGAAAGAGALGTVGQALPYLGAALGVGQTIAGDAPDLFKAINSAAYAAAPFTSGLSALIPMLIGSGPTSSSIGREAAKDRAQSQALFRELEKGFATPEQLAGLRTRGDLAALMGQFNQSYASRVHDIPYQHYTPEGIGAGMYDTPFRGKYTPQAQALATRLHGQLPEGAAQGSFAKMIADQQAHVAALQAQEETAMQQPGTGIVPGMGRFLGYGEGSMQPLFSPLERSQEESDRLRNLWISG